MSDTKFWKPVYQLFKPEEPLTQAEDLRDFYVQRANSPVEDLINALEMEDDPAKFLLAGHRGSGKSTELRLLQDKLKESYTVIWIDTETALERYNIGYAEVVVLIGQEICRQAIQPGWWSKKDERLLKALEDSLKLVIYSDKKDEVDGLELPEVLKKMGMTLKQGITREMTKSLNIRPVLSEVITKVNDIIKAAEKDRKQKLLVLVDGLDRHDEKTALEMFSSPLLAELDCHIIYAIPISLRYSPSFRQPMQSFQKCLDLTNPSVFECDQNLCPTANPNRVGRDILIKVINKRLARLDASHKGIFNTDALELICEKSGGVIRDLVRLARTACGVALRKNLLYVDLDTAKEAVQEDRKEYNLSDYHFPELDTVHLTGRLTTNTHSLPSKGQFVICDELLQNKFVLGYYDTSRKSWFDINPILSEDLERWQALNPPQNQ
ncbi:MULTISPECIES: P-loop NTPase fold protein [Cyanophyceae]|uniref:P-loop NTPase fold protein n=1 Tax=Cyanophyceae TaxID=3028117 RepID=UPI00168551A3|nr:P-loop NTPase fold protein [Trichocoleus sp. FACHB-69]MBD1933295.1 AAA family ATPase [Trichocoleus sp. FACHB-69]